MVEVLVTHEVSEVKAAAYAALDVRWIQVEAGGILFNPHLWFRNDGLSETTCDDCKRQAARDEERARMEAGYQRADGSVPWIGLVLGVRERGGRIEEIWTQNLFERGAMVLTRDEVVTLMEHGKQFHPLYANLKSKRDAIGPNVRIVKIKGITYLRVSRTDRPADDFGDVERF